jgi:hypothetical protein
MDLIKETFAHFEALDSRLRRSLPYGIYLLHCVTALHARLNEIERLNSRVYDRDFDIAFFSTKFVHHPAIVQYLAGLGNITTPEGEEFWLAAPTARPTVRGDFGRFTPATSTVYQAIPAPRLVYEFIQAQLAPAHRHEVHWQIPEGLRPEEVDGIEWLESENLLGWSPSFPISNHERTAYSNYRFAPGVTPNDRVSNYLFSPSMMSYTSLVLKSNIKLVTSEHNPGLRTGSLAQLPYLQSTDPIDLVPRQSYIHEEIDIHSRFSSPNSTASATAICAYRVERTALDDGVLPYLGFSAVSPDDDRTFVPAPPAYALQLNALFSSNQTPRLNMDYFQSPSFSRTIKLRDVVQQFARPSG